MAVYEIAGLRVDLQTFGRTLRQAEPYRTGDGPAQITLRCDPDRVLALNPDLTDRDMAEYMGTGALFARQLLSWGGFQLHASAVELEGKAYLFSAPCGTGKSTHTEKWVRLFGARYLNDDKPALRCVDGTWMAFGTPWSGKHDLSSPRGVPLGGIAYVERGDSNAIVRLAPEAAVPLLFSQCQRLLPAQQMEVLLTHLDGLLGQVPVWHLRCLPDDGSAVMSKGAMVP